MIGTPAYWLGVLSGAVAVLALVAVAWLALSTGCGLAEQQEETS